MKPTYKYKMEIFHSGDALDNLINLVSKFNDGDCDFTLDELRTYLKIRALLYPILSNAILDFNEEGVACIHNGDSSKPFMKITRIELYELQES